MWARSCRFLNVFQMYLEIEFKRWRVITRRRSARRETRCCGSTGLKFLKSSIVWTVVNVNVWANIVQMCISNIFDRTRYCAASSDSDPQSLCAAWHFECLNIWEFKFGFWDPFDLWCLDLLSRNRVQTHCSDSEVLFRIFEFQTTVRWRRAVIQHSGSNFWKARSHGPPKRWGFRNFESD